MWYLNDLQDLDKLETLFLFGSAHEAHWKLPERSVIGLLNPDVKEDREKGKLRFTLSINHPLKLLVLGKSKDFGICQSHTKSGENCTKIVNKSKCEFCTYHSMHLLKKGAKRPELAAYGSQNFLAKRPKQEQSVQEKQRIASSLTASAFGPCLQPGKAPIVDNPSASGSNASVSAGLPSANRVKSLLPSTCAGAKNVALLEEKQKTQQAMKAFQLPATDGVAKPEKVDTTSWGQHMLKVMEARVSGQTNIAKSRREKIANLIKSGRIEAPTKVDPNRPTLPNSPQLAIVKNEKEKTTPVSKKKVDEKKKKKEVDEAMKLLETKSKHSTAAEDAFMARADAYFKALEPRDRAEQQLSETFKIKVNAYICKSCNYIAPSPADRCKKDHPNTVKGPVDAWRRFFACKQCKFRTTTFSMVPTDPCVKCRSSSWQKAPVRDIGAWKPEKLSIGTEEMPNFADDDGDGPDAGLDYGTDS